MIVANICMINISNVLWNQTNGRVLSKELLRTNFRNSVQKKNKIFLIDVMLIFSAFTKE